MALIDARNINKTLNVITSCVFLSGDVKNTQTSNMFKNHVKLHYDLL